MIYTEEAIKNAVTKAYSEGYKDGQEVIKKMVYSAFDIWENADTMIAERNKQTERTEE